MWQALKCVLICFLSDANNWFNINEGDVPPCDRHPCQHGGQCELDQDDPHKHSCNCTGTGYMGISCERIAACNVSEICNGGDCQLNEFKPHTPLCLCPFGKTGALCEKRTYSTVKVVHGI